MAEFLLNKDRIGWLYQEKLKNKVTIQYTLHREVYDFKTRMNPSMELLENVLFSIVLNHNPLDSGKVLNRYKTRRTTE